MVEYLNDQKFKEFTELFSTFDYYSKGHISAASVHSILSSMQLKISYEDAIQLIKETGNKSENYDKVSLSEFLAIVSMYLSLNAV